MATFKNANLEVIVLKETRKLTWIILVHEKIKSYNKFRYGRCVYRSSLMVNEYQFYTSIKMNPTQHTLFHAIR
jgi:hypothetical protein